jgi:predicted nucleic acid-binding protein
VPLNIPTGATVFIDANIFYYHFVSLPGLSIACKNFLHRIEQGEITGVTATVVLAEAQHKVMLAEAVQKYGLSPQGLVRRLTQTPGLLVGLSHHRIVPSTVVAMHVRIEPLTMAILQQAADLSVTHELLTNDAALLAHMQALGITHLATNDDDFDKVTGITVWKPR